MLWWGFGAGLFVAGCVCRLAFHGENASRESCCSDRSLCLCYTVGRRKKKEIEKDNKRTETKPSMLPPKEELRYFLLSCLLRGNAKRVKRILSNISHAKVEMGNWEGFPRGSGCV